MGKVLQKRKNRSSIPRSKHRSGKVKNGNKKINVLGNAIVAKNWYFTHPRRSCPCPLIRDDGILYETWKTHADVLLFIGIEKLP